jgi:adenosylcobinamide kinase/adenosylcobinamide-phosphate guanylyltransferase
MSKRPAKELILVLGGARSGKSSWALHYAEERYETFLFLATARSLDDEMAERIRLHKSSRGPEWQLVEEPIEISEALKTRCGDVETVLIDCLTVWLSNVMFEMGMESIDFYREGLLTTLSVRERNIIVVSNELGMGIVPENPIGRKFRDLSGQVNQNIAAMADKVVFLMAGLPMVLKDVLLKPGVPPLEDLFADKEQGLKQEEG